MYINIHLLISNNYSHIDVYSILIFIIIDNYQTIHGVCICVIAELINSPLWCALSLITQTLITNYENIWWKIFNNHIPLYGHNGINLKWEILAIIIYLLYNITFLFDITV